MTDRPAARTPGAAAIAASRRSSRSRRAAGSATAAGRLTVATVRPPAAKPSCVPLSAANVRRNRPAPTTRTSDNAICATTRAPRTLRRRSPVTVRDDSFIASPGATPVTESAGTIPAITAVTAARPAVKPRTRQSSDRSRNTDPRHVASCWTSRALLHFAKSTPRAAPAATMTAVSTASRRVTRHREAPRARRTLNSRRRASARASIRLARLAQAISSTTATVACIARSGVSNRLRSGDRPVAADTSVSGSSRKLSSSAGAAAVRIPGCSVTSAALACSRLTPGFRRPMISSHHIRRTSRPLSTPRRMGSAAKGIITSFRRPTSGPEKPGGITPTMVKGWRSSVSVAPIALSAPA